MLLILVGAFSVKAQDFQVGPKIGFNSARLSIDNQNFDPESTVGFRAGGFIEVPLSNSFSFNRNCCTLQKVLILIRCC